jgi:hypothetical protein
MTLAADGGDNQAIATEALSPFADTTGTIPRSTTSRRHYGCPLNCTPRAGDGRLVPAGLLAHGSCAPLPPSRRKPDSGIWGDARRLQLRGQPRH